MSRPCGDGSTKSTVTEVGQEAVEHAPPGEIIAELKLIEARISEDLAKLEEMLG